MKRFTLILAAVFCLATAAVNAQTYVGDIQEYEFYTIPGAFTTNGHPYVVYSTYIGDETYNFSICQSDFTTHVTDINLQRFGYFYADCDNIVENRSLVFTQNLFNSDEHFEYIEYEGFIQDWDYTITSIHIKSTNGNTLSSFYPDDGFQFFGSLIFKLDNKYYLLLSEKNENDEYKYPLYLISQSQGLTKVETELPITVFPSIVNRSQQITVELGEGNNATEVTVINGLGQVIRRMPLQKGQRQVTIPAQDLNSGLNVVNTRTQQGQGSCKIIVR